MTQTYSREHLSQDLYGAGLVLGTVGAKTHVHTLASNAGPFTDLNPRISHELWIYIVNNDSLDRTVTVGWADTTAGGSGGGGSLIKFKVKRNTGLNLLIAGLLLSQHPSVPLHINMYADAAGGPLVVHGYVNKILSV